MCLNIAFIFSFIFLGGIVKRTWQQTAQNSDRMHTELEGRVDVSVTCIYR